MTRDSKPDRPGGDMPAEPRAARLKAALKANIAKRKAQARARDADAPDDDDAGRNDTD